MLSKVFRFPHKIEMQKIVFSRSFFAIYSNALEGSEKQGTPRGQATIFSWFKAFNTEIWCRLQVLWGSRCINSPIRVPDQLPSLYRRSPSSSLPPTPSNSLCLCYWENFNNDLITFGILRLFSMFCIHIYNIATVWRRQWKIPVQLCKVFLIINDANNFFKFLDRK